MYNQPLEIFHSISDETVWTCDKCSKPLQKQVTACQHVIIKDGTLQHNREEDHSKKVKDRERAEKSRKKAFGSDAVGSGSDNPKYRQGKEVGLKGNIKGKALGGQMKEIDKQEFIKAAARDEYTVAKCQEALKKSDKKS